MMLRGCETSPVANALEKVISSILLYAARKHAESQA